MGDRNMLLWLEAPLQSWGHDSRFGRRDTLDFPTRSGVTGLICCALGAAGEQHELLSRLASSDIRVEAYPRADEQGRPVPRPPLMRDFHMVGSGYDGHDPWESLLIPKKADGTASSTAIKMTYRYAIQDMAFAVVLGLPDDLAETIAKALVEPRWDVFLGRKSFVPTEMIFQGIHATHDEALSAARELASAKGRAPAFRVLEGEHEGDEVMTLNDVPVQFGEDKRYRDRRVTVQWMME
ncbi:type I-E CRISPR-associated protein Cas5/CasD [Guyparkeria hydrothermalis]|uniref:type I-E CRISPR-associated protein Cas5/CasD n=1 Tax=Guyparkeria hydrothermalis TaxID=923 RepID=UPI0020207A8A|nr:type I-E CRISPR-associated protein Cas5/CasD [Guyparkeria hydrothermalis]MCL7750262.1 type I-E CRISPR-associated protein Cas5/CasD [Guyparkeria hydrothermalis]